MTDNKYWKFLEAVRRSGQINMFGAASLLAENFRIPKDEAQRILTDWMKNYNPDDYKEET